MYHFLAAILPYDMPQWEKLSVFLTLHIPKLPFPKDEDLSKGILQSVDLDSYRAEIQATRSQYLKNKPAEIDPVTMGSFTGEPGPEWDYLTNIISDFHKRWGFLDWKNPDVVAEQVSKLPAQVAVNTKWQNARKNAGKDDARTESNNILQCTT
jgi:type I restriction enzyme R subunit